MKKSSLARNICNLLVVMICTGFLLFSHITNVQAATLPPIKTVFLIMMESYPWSTVSTYPYIGGTLAKIGGYATQYTKPAGTGNNLLSLPEYIWLESGDNLGITTDDDPALVSQSTTQHLATQLNNKGVNWREYAEDITGTDCPVTEDFQGQHYAVRHNPFVYFQDSTNNNSSTSSYCINHNRPYSELATDLANNTVAQYNFITPNTCDDMHDNCPGDPVAQGDTWLSQQIPIIMNSQAYKNGGAIFITWDNDDYSVTEPIGMIVLSPYLKSPGYHNSISYDHSSTLKTMEEIFGVPLIRAAASTSTNDLSDFFTAGSVNPTPTPSASPSPTITPTPTPTPNVIPGDANGDGKVDNADYTIWLSGSLSADFNHDGVVDGVDYVIWLINYGRSAASSPSPGTVGFVQGTTSTLYGIDTSQTTTFNQAVKTGNTVVVAVSDWNAANSALSNVIGVTDNYGNTYHKAVEGGVGTDIQLNIWYSLNVKGGSNFAVTANFNSQLQPTIAIHEYSGITGIDPSTNYQTGDTTAVANSGTITTLSPNEILFGAINFSDSINLSGTPGSGFTARQSVTDGTTYVSLFTEDKIVNTTGQYSASYTFPQILDWRAGVIGLLTGGTISPTPSPTVTPTPSSGNVTITINKATIAGTTSFGTSATHTQDDAYFNGYPNVSQYYQNAYTYQVAPIMGWDVEDPEPSPGTYNFASLDARVALMQNTNATPILTFCCSPGWMRATGYQDDWGYLGTAPDPSHVQDFANLAAKIAQRYPNVKYFQVWNELKGMYSDDVGCTPTACGQNRWDYERYTTLYNAVWDAVKAVRPDALLGGPYVDLQTFGADTTASNLTGPYGTIDQRGLDVVNYWFQNKHGANFIALDGGTLPVDGVWDSDEFTASQYLIDIDNWVRNLNYPEAKTLPIVWAEWYPSPQINGGINYFNAVLMNSLIYGMKAGASWIPTWGTTNNSNNDMTGDADIATILHANGTTTPTYDSTVLLKTYFPPGTKWYNTTVTPSSVTVFASVLKTMLVNRTNNTQIVNVSGTAVTLSPYQVTVINTP